MCVTIYRKFCSTEGVAAGFCMDRKSNIKTAICASLSRWLSIVILSLFTHFVNIHTVDHNIQDFRIGIPGMVLQVLGGYLFIKYLVYK